MISLCTASSGDHTRQCTIYAGGEKKRKIEILGVIIRFLRVLFIPPKKSRAVNPRCGELGMKICVRRGG
jgi:hypothetical protein